MVDKERKILKSELWSKSPRFSNRVEARSEPFFLVFSVLSWSEI